MGILYRLFQTFPTQFDEFVAYALENDVPLLFDTQELALTKNKSDLEAEIQRRKNITVSCHPPQSKVFTGVKTAQILIAEYTDHINLACVVPYLKGAKAMLACDEVSLHASALQAQLFTATTLETALLAKEFSREKRMYAVNDMAPAELIGQTRILASPTLAMLNSEGAVRAERSQVCNMQYHHTVKRKERAGNGTFGQEIICGGDISVDEERHKVLRKFTLEQRYFFPTETTHFSSSDCDTYLKSIENFLALQEHLVEQSIITSTLYIARAITACGNDVMINGDSPMLQERKLERLQQEIGDPNKFFTIPSNDKND